MPKFKPGESGNTRGRPRGSRNKLTELRQRLVDALPGVLDAIIAAAEGGSWQHAKLIVDKALPNLKPVDQPIRLRLQGSLAERAHAFNHAVANARISAEQGSALMRMLADEGRIIETAELVARIQSLERLLGRINK